MFRPTAAFVLLLTASPAFAQEPLDLRLPGALDKFVEQSCANAAHPAPFETLDLSISPAPLDPQDVGVTLPPGVSFAGGWQLQFRDEVFGGLSGLAILPDGDFLSVTDTGRFVRIGRDNAEPLARAEIAEMRFSNPLVRPGKLTADAEGLDVSDGIALVSFERDFRVLAFALERCGAVARGIEIADPPSRYGLRPIRANAGPEALWIDENSRVRLLYEQLRDDRPVAATVTDDSRARLETLVPVPPLEPGFRPVGADQVDDPGVTAHLYRAYDRESGNRVRLDLLPIGAEPVVIRLAPPLATDNFEGVAMEGTEDGLRVWIVSDDNFSDRQRTLLYAFDVTRSALSP
ncbi:MAG: esterase-like activity of phytase family protein [Litorimonas sp.]